MGEPHGMRLRDAALRDAPAVAAIYNAGIEDRVATFETQARTVKERRAWIARHDARHPVLVAEVDTGVVAFASVEAYRARACYDGVGEFSVYVDRGARGRGVGRALMRALLTRCEGLGYWKLVGRVFTTNEPSRALCRSVGFREVGIYEHHARLDGVWRDCVIVERLMGDARSRETPAGV